MPPDFFRLEYKRKPVFFKEQKIKKWEKKEKRQHRIKKEQRAPNPL